MEGTNNLFSQFSELDKKELISFLDNFYLHYRNNLNFNDNTLTFGIEIEFEKILLEEVEQLLINSNLKNWLTKKERSIITGGEINSTILNDNQTNWLEIKKVCSILKENNAKISENCGGHVHFGSNILGDNYNSWLTFIKCIIAFEKVLFRFGYGEEVKERHSVRKFAYPVSYLLKEILYSDNIDFNNINTEKLLDIIKDRTSKRSSVSFQKICIKNLDNIKNNTIEFRFPNGTIEEIIWQNNINTLGKLLLAVKNDKIDIDVIDFLLKNIQKENNINVLLMDYGSIHLNTALLFCDMIFDNDLDKLYFLRQYIKNSYKDTYQERQKKFIIN